MEKKKILVLTDHMPWGHRSIAKAIYGFLKTKEKSGGVEVVYREVKSEMGIVGDIYSKLIYLIIPKIGSIIYKLDKNNLANQVANDLCVKNLPRLKEVIKEVKPDLIISAYFVYSFSLAAWKKESGAQLKLWTVVADPWTIYSASIVPGADMHLIYDEVGVKMAEEMGIEKNKVLMTGWWVRGEMYNNKKDIKKELGIEENQPVVFFGGGSLGTNAITKFLPVLFLIKQKCTIIFNTGTDKMAFKMVTEFKKMFDRIRTDGKVNIINLGWIENMAEVLAISDIVFGKAGPNFLFDVVASEKPFVAITHIGGQEDGNIDLILKKKLGWIKEGIGEAEDFLVEYLKDPKKYNKKYAKSIAVEAKNNSKTMEKIWGEIKTIF